ncbi:MAG: DUF2238 domain-containing protein [Myxococcales bacterium]|nr:MAG: DUF2238 domain-containing protein [Myxococcales bacterium]
MSTYPSPRLPAALLAALAVLCLLTGWSPAEGHKNWALEVAPGLGGVAILCATYRRFPQTPLVYVCTFLHMLVLLYGGYYTYAKVPLGEWVKEVFHLQRNHYDRVGHLALGFFPVPVTRELLLRTSPLGRGGWQPFLVFCVIFSVGAFWELLEWWVTLLVAGDVGQAFLGSQGDIWDAQWDMFLVGVGAVVALLVLPRLHDRQLARLAAAGAPRPAPSA